MPGTKSRKKHPKLSGTKTFLSESRSFIKALEKSPAINEIRPLAKIVEDYPQIVETPITWSSISGRQARCLVRTPNCRQEILLTVEDHNILGGIIEHFNQQMSVIC
jgi:hypothetical protein